MVEPVTIGVIVAALAAKALARAEDAAMDQGEAALKRLLGGLRKIFGGEAAGSTELVRLEDAPDSPSRAQELAAAIDARAAAEPELRAKLEELVAEAEQSDVAVKEIVQEATGNQIVQIADVSDSSIQVNTGGTGNQQPPAGS